MDRLNQLCIKILNNRLYRLLIVAVYIISVILLFPRSYGSNDDVALVWNISSGFNAQFMSTFLGKIISLFYLYCNGIAWYPIILYILYSIILYIMIEIVLKVEIFKSYIIVAVIGLLTANLFLLIGISYNTVSILMGICGIVYLYLKDEKNRFDFIKAGVIISLSYMVRKDGVIAAIVFSLPLLLIIIKNHRKIVIYMIIPLMIIISLEKAVNILSYSINKEEKKFSEYNDIRGKIHTYPFAKVLIDNKEMLSKNNWGQLSYYGFLKFFYIDEDRFSKEKIETILKYAKNENYMELYQNTFKTGIKQLFNKMQNRYLWIFITYCMLFFILFKNDNRLFKVYCGYLFYSYFIVVLLFTFLRFPERIEIPITYGILLLILSLVKKSRGIKKNGYMNLLFAIFVFIGMFVGIKEKLWNQKISEVRNSYILNSLEEKNMKLIFVPFDQSICIELENNDILKANSIVNNVIPTGWMTFSPKYYDFIKKEFNANNAQSLITAISKRNDVGILMREENEVVFMGYIKKDFKNIELIKEKVLLEDIFGKLSLYRLREVSKIE